MFLLFVYFSVKTKPVCTDEQFHCVTGGCIDKTLVCNKKPDCEDKSDEKHCRKFIGKTFS